jgi:membrane protease YdiL (CAAX protease family)
VFTIGERLLLTLWVGALWAVGYLAVPTLFALLGDRILAGMLAGRMFTLVSFLGLFCGGVLLLGSVLRQGKSALRSVRVWLLVVMLLLVAVGEFAVQPLMAQLKAQGLAEGSAQATQFARLHGVASVLYLINSLCGLLLVGLGEKSG